MSVSIERFGGGCKLLAEWCRASTEPGAHGILYINITLVEKQKKGNDWQLEWTKAMPHLKVRKLKKHVLFVSKSKSKSRGIFQIMWVNLCALPYNSASISSSALLHCFITNNCHKKRMDMSMEDACSTVWQAVLDKNRPCTERGHFIAYMYARMQMSIHSSHLLCMLLIEPNGPTSSPHVKDIHGIWRMRDQLEWIQEEHGGRLFLFKIAQNCCIQKHACDSLLRWITLYVNALRLSSYCSNWAVWQSLSLTHYHH